MARAIFLMFWAAAAGRHWQVTAMRPPGAGVAVLLTGHGGPDKLVYREDCLAILLGLDPSIHRRRGRAKAEESQGGNPNRRHAFGAPRTSGTYRD
ncbi:MAG: hypothetical protein AB7F08_09535 [Dongiaceae bacterium]